MQVVGREEARSMGLKHYYTGTPCVHGHDSPRYVNTTACVKCIIDRSTEYREKNRGKQTEYNKAYWAKIKDSRTPEEMAKRNESRAKYQKKNPGKVTAASRKHQLAKLKRTPAWADLDKIEGFYLLSAKMTEETKIQHNVDHIIPLQGKLVSGLHVPDNLRVIPASQNQTKNNKFNIEEYNATYRIRTNPDFLGPISG